MILNEIVAHKRREVAAREATAPLEVVCRRAQEAPPPRVPEFAGAMSVIAEIKRKSPSTGDLAPTLDPVEQARAYERGGASAVSVLTDEHYFGGDFADLVAVRSAVSLPVLCKDFILTPYQVYEARSHGADLILLIAGAMTGKDLETLRALAVDVGMTPLVEVHDQHDLARAIAVNAELIGINNRDLTDFSVDLLTTEYLAPLVPDDIVVVSESGIATREDVQRVARAGARAILVGGMLVRAEDPAAAIRELLS
jgi:indole-3-glycerol phosphate synthase